MLKLTGLYKKGTNFMANNKKNLWSINQRQRQQNQGKKSESESERLTKTCKLSAFTQDLHSQYQKQITVSVHCLTSRKQIIHPDWKKSSIKV